MGDGDGIAVYWTALTTGVSGVAETRDEGAAVVGFGWGGSVNEVLNGFFISLGVRWLSHFLHAV